MNLFKNVLFLGLTMLLFISCKEKKKIKTYEPTWESLSSRPSVPEWFKDAKFGIYTSWGPTSIISAKAGRKAQWIIRDIYREDNPVGQYFRKKYGDPSEFGFKDLIKLWTARKFNAEEWADVFQRSGAKFAGPMAIFIDNFALWNSKETRWNSVNMGPQRDIVGELEKAIKKRGMKFIVTNHSAFAWYYTIPSYQYDARDTTWSDLYLMPHKRDDPPSKRFIKSYQSKVKELIDQYSPAMLWFDSGFGRIRKLTPDSTIKQIFSYYYNTYGDEGMIAHKGKPITEKGVGIWNIERGRPDHLTDYPWMTDTPMGHWFYDEAINYRSADYLVDLLTDITSKNGALLLNVGPRADGVIPDSAKTRLFEIGNWLKINGEAIYNTRPWKVYGEGPTQMPKSGRFSETNIEYTPKDIRYTQSKDHSKIYAIFLGWPGKNKTVTLSSITDTLDVKGVTMFGSYEDTDWKWNEKGQLNIIMPSHKVDNKAVAVRINLQ